MNSRMSQGFNSPGFITHSNPHQSQDDLMGSFSQPKPSPAGSQCPLIDSPLICAGEVGERSADQEQHYSSPKVSPTIAKAIFGLASPESSQDLSPSQDSLSQNSFSSTSDNKPLPETFIVLIRGFYDEKRSLDNAYRTKFLEELANVGITTIMQLDPYKESFSKVAAEMLNKSELYTRMLAAREDFKAGCSMVQRSREAAKASRTKIVKDWCTFKATCEEDGVEISQAAKDQHSSALEKAKNVVKQIVTPKPAPWTFEELQLKRQLKYQWDLFRQLVFKMVRHKAN